MKTNYRNSLTAGIVFGIVTIFLFLIGFTGTAADLLGKALQPRLPCTGSGPDR